VHIVGEDAVEADVLKAEFAMNERELCEVLRLTKLHTSVSGTNADTEGCIALAFDLLEVAIDMPRCGLSQQA